jgi:hypothetical protein
MHEPRGRWWARGEGLGRCGSAGAVGGCWGGMRQWAGRLGGGHHRQACGAIGNCSQLLRQA